MKPIDFGKTTYTSVTRDEWERMQREAKPLSELLKRKKMGKKECV